jgi:uncharacterized protein (TIGR02300 family)
VAKPELGTKRLCANCGAKFYDLGKDPIVCPKCDTVFVIPVVSTRAPRADAARAANPVKEQETTDAEFVSLEDADAETQGKSSRAAKAVDVNDVDDVEDDDAGLDDDTFIEEEEEGDADVTDIIGDAGDKDDDS